MLLYVAAWVAIGALIVAGVIVARGGPAREAGVLPPVQETELTTAAARAGCELTRASERRPGNPPAGGAYHERPVAGGVYKRSPPTAALTAALRRGTVVVHYHPRLEDDIVDRLKSLQAALPKGTILTPNATRMSYDVAITAYHRVLGCPRVTATALDAVRLFRGRYLGSGPDS